MSKDEVMSMNEMIEQNSINTGIISDKSKQNEKENKKAKKLFILILAISIAVGFGFGIAGAIVGDKLNGVDITTLINDGVIKGLGVSAPFITVLLVVGTYLYTYLNYMKCKSKWLMMKEPEDEMLDALENRLSGTLAVGSVATIICFFEFSAGFYYFIHYKDTFWFIVQLLAFSLNLFLVITSQQKIVDLIKLMNPEKRGSVYDTKFQDNWLNSCDEAEKMLIYKCSYHSYRVTISTCTGLWVVFTLLSMILKISLLPVATVTVIWLVMMVSYLLQVKKLESISLRD